MQINMEYIKGQLQRRAHERQLTAVARASGVNLRTLQRLAKGVTGTLSTADKVQQFLVKTERDKNIEEKTK